MADFDWNSVERWTREWNQNNVNLISSSCQFEEPPWGLEYTSRGSDDDQHNYFDKDSFFLSESSTDSACEGDHVSNDDTVVDSSETRRPPPPSTSLTLLTPSGGTGEHLGEASKGDYDVSDNDTVDDSSEGENEDGDGTGSYGDSKDGDSSEDGIQSGNEATPCEKDCMHSACMMYVNKEYLVPCCRLAELNEEATRREMYEKDLAAQREQDLKTLFDMTSMYETRPNKYLAALRELRKRREKNDYLQPSSMQQPISPPSERMKMSMRRGSTHGLLLHQQILLCLQWEYRGVWLRIRILMREIPRPSNLKAYLTLTSMRFTPH